MRVSGEGQEKVMLFKEPSKEWVVLFTLHGEEGLGFNELARRVKDYMSKNTLIKVLSGLEEAGFVEIRGGVRRGQKKVISLSPMGRKFVSLFMKLLLKLREREEEALLELMERAGHVNAFLGKLRKEYCLSDGAVNVLRYWLGMYYWFKSFVDCSFQFILAACAGGFSTEMVALVIKALGGELLKMYSEYFVDVLWDVVSEVGKDPSIIKRVCRDDLLSKIVEFQFITSEES